MPDAGDGFTIISAMRHAHPSAITLVLTGYPALQEVMTAIMLQADEILVKPVGLTEIVKIIQEKLSKPEARVAMEFQAFPENIEDVFIVIREKNALFHFSSIFVCTVAGRVVTYNPITYWGTQSGAT
jgi:DNA-binding response OmpR family regulator